MMDVSTVRRLTMLYGSLAAVQSDRGSSGVTAGGAALEHNKEKNNSCRAVRKPYG